MTLLNEIRSAIQNLYQDACITDKAGTYGHVFFIKRADGTCLCAKTINPEKLRSPECETAKPLLGLRELFDRELRIWFSLPPHLTILQPLRIEILEMEGSFPLTSIPAVLMPQCADDLRSWINASERPSQSDCLILMGQVLGGLRWMYGHGIEGHGDLKPENILFSDLRAKCSLPNEGVLSNQHPWRAQVADLGWADIWREVSGETEKCWRPYKAPERMDGHVVPEKSDIFAVGIIIYELLTGMHPLGRPSAKIDKTKWENKLRDLRGNITGIESSHLRDLIISCVDPDPARRPTAREAINEIDLELCRSGEPRVQPLIDCWDDYGRAASPSLVRNRIASAMKQLGGPAADKAIEELERTLIALNPREGVVPTPDWFALSLELGKLLIKRDQLGDRLKAQSLLRTALSAIVGHFGTLDLRLAFYGLAGGGYIQSIEPWEVTRDAANDLISNLDRTGPPGSEEVRIWEIRVKEKLANETPALSETIESLASPDLCAAAKTVLASSLETEWADVGLDVTKRYLDHCDPFVRKAAEYLVQAWQREISEPGETDPNQ